MTPSERAASWGISVDPGTWGHGVALWECGRLVWCGYVGEVPHKGVAPARAERALKIADAQTHVGFVDWSVIEAMRVRRGKPAQDLIAVAFAAGALMSGWGIPPACCAEVEPAVWKGQVPKKIAHARILAVLDAVERRAWDAVDASKKLAHNVYDAVGLGLWALGRKW